MTQPTFVLVHGLFHSGRSWQPLVDRLRDAGATVFAPDLLGSAEGGPAYFEVADMAEHTRPVRDVIEAAKQPVILVGHSLGGVSVTYLAQQIPEKIARVVYIAGMVFANGESGVAGIITEPEAANHPDAQDLASLLLPADNPMGLTLDMSDLDKVRRVFYADCDDDVVAAAVTALVPTQSILPLLWVSDITPDRFGSLPRVYIETIEDHAIPISTQRAMQARVPGATVVTAQSSHSPFLSQPDTVAEMLLSAAE